MVYVSVYVGNFTIILPLMIIMYNILFVIEVTKLLSFLAQSCHELVPAEVSTGSFTVSIIQYIMLLCILKIIQYHTIHNGIVYIQNYIFNNSHISVQSYL